VTRIPPRIRFALGLHPYDCREAIARGIVTVHDTTNRSKLAVRNSHFRPGFKIAPGSGDPRPDLVECLNHQFDEALARRRAQTKIAHELRSYMSGSAS